MGKRTGRLAVYRHSREHASEKAAARTQRASIDPDYAAKVRRWNATGYRNWKDKQIAHGSYDTILNRHVSQTVTDPNSLSTAFIDKMCKSVKKR